jgi:hypothetical protein
VKIKFSSEERQYWANVLIAASQITFGLAWASFFVSVEEFKVFVIVLNSIASILLWLGGWWLIRKKK